MINAGQGCNPAGVVNPIEHMKGLSMSAHRNPFQGNYKPPSNVIVRQVASLELLQHEVGQRSLMGFSGLVLFGVAFIQGGRLQFTSAVPIGKFMDLAITDRALKPSGDNPRLGTLDHLSEHSNRPKVAAHSNRLRTYLLETACQGEKFFLPSFTLNCGAAADEDTEDKVELVVFSVGSGGGNVCFPALLFLPSIIALALTDGAHRYSMMADILGSQKVADALKEALRRNSVDLKIVFEPDLADAHQDFADAGKAQPIAKSVLASFDLRDERNQIAKDLVTSNAFLRIFVDATASSQNVPSKSPKVWAMSAMRMFVDQVVRLNQAKAEAEAEEMKKSGVPVEPVEANPQAIEDALHGAVAFFEALITHVPTLRDLESHRNNPGNYPASPADLREQGGGDVVLKAAFLAIASRAFFMCREQGIRFNAMALALGSIPWQVLKGEKSDLDKDIEASPDASYGEVLSRHLRPHLQPLVTVAEGRYRIVPAVKDVDLAWNKHLRPMLDAAMKAPKLAAAS